MLSNLRNFWRGDAVICMSPADYEKATGGHACPAYNDKLPLQRYFIKAKQAYPPGAVDLYWIPTRHADGTWHLVSTPLYAFQVAYPNIPSDGVVANAAAGENEIPLRPLAPNETLTTVMGVPTVVTEQPAPAPSGTELHKVFTMVTDLWNKIVKNQ